MSENLKKMKKERLKLLLLFIVAVTTIVIVVFLNFGKKPQIHTDITELYSYFTGYMERHIDSHLEWLGCEPQQYSDDGSTICFMCEDSHPCFGYGWVNRGREGMKMNPRGLPYLDNVGSVGGLKVKFVDFCHQGLASQFNCQEKESYNELECDKIKFSARVGEILRCEKMSIELMEGVDFQNFAEYFCELKNEELKSLKSYPERSSSTAFCQNYIIFLQANKIKIIEGNFNED